MPKFNFDDVNNSLVVYDNPQFAMFEKCSDTDRNMTWREWIKNAIEAAVKVVMDNLPEYKDEEKLNIFVRALPVDGLLEGIPYTHPKLGTLQPGGMDFPHLQTATKMSCSYDKTQGIRDGNRGNGIRITASLHTDLLFITRKNGVSIMRLIGWRGSKDKPNFYQTSIERCDEWVEKNKELRSYPEGDFTEVIFMGVESDAKQNTLLRPFGEDEDQSRSTCISTIFKRFWEIPQCVRIAFQPGKNQDSTPHGAGFKSRKTSNLYFKTWPEVFEESKKTIATAKDSIYRKQTSQDGYTLHQYVEAPNEKGEPSSKGISASHDSKNFSAMLWGKKGSLEMYNVLTGSRPLQKFYGKFGIIFGHSMIKFFLEMPYELYKEDPTRKYIVNEGDATNKHVTLHDDKIIEKMKTLIHPDIQEKINELNKDKETDNIDDLIKKELMNYIQDNLDVSKGKSNKNRRPRNKDVTPRDPKICPDCGTQVKHSVMECPSCGYEWKRRKKSAVSDKNQLGNYDAIVPPQFDQLYGESIKTAGMSDTFARMHRHGGENGRDLILINTEHSVIDKFVRKVKNFDDDLDALLREAALRLLKVKLAVFVILALGRHEKGSIDDTALESLFSDVVLTMNVEQHNDSVPKLKNMISDLKAQFIAQQNDGSTVINKDVITDGSDARDTALEQRLVAAGGKLPTKR